MVQTFFPSEQTIYDAQKYVTASVNATWSMAREVVVQKPVLGCIFAGAIGVGVFHVGKLFWKGPGDSRRLSERVLDVLYVTLAKVLAYQQKII